MSRPAEMYVKVVFGDASAGFVVQYAGDCTGTYQDDVEKQIAVVRNVRIPGKPVCDGACAANAVSPTDWRGGNDRMQACSTRHTGKKKIYGVSHIDGFPGYDSSISLLAHSTLGVGEEDDSWTNCPVLSRHGFSCSFVYGTGLTLHLTSKKRGRQYQYRKVLGRKATKSWESLPIRHVAQRALMHTNERFTCISNGTRQRCGMKKKRPGSCECYILCSVAGTIAAR